MAQYEHVKHQQEAELVARAYEAAFQGGSPATLMAAILQLMDADAGVWIGCNIATQTAGELAQAGLDETMMQSYNALGWRSPLAPLIIQAPGGTPSTDRMLMERGQFERSDFYQEWSGPAG